MRLPPTERNILSLLSDGGPSYGLQLVHASGGRLKRGGIYVTLGRMEEKGLVSSTKQDDARRIYGHERGACRNPVPPHAVVPEDHAGRCLGPALAAGALMVLVMGWAIPAAGHAFREIPFIRSAGVGLASRRLL